MKLWRGGPNIIIELGHRTAGAHGICVIRTATRSNTHVYQPVFALFTSQSTQCFPAAGNVCTCVLRPDPLCFRADFRNGYKGGAVIRCNHLRLAPRRVIKARQVPADWIITAAFPAGVGHHSSRRRGQDTISIADAFHTEYRQYTRVIQAQAVGISDVIAIVD